MIESKRFTRSTNLIKIDRTKLEKLCPRLEDESRFERSRKVDRGKTLRQKESVTREGKKVRGVRVRWKLALEEKLIRFNSNDAAFAVIPDKGLSLLCTSSNNESILTTTPAYYGVCSKSRHSRRSGIVDINYTHTGARVSRPTDTTT